MFMMFLYACMHQWKGGGGGGQPPKNFFQAFWPQFGLKVRGAWAPLPLPGICHCMYMLAFVAFR